MDTKKWSHVLFPIFCGLGNHIIEIIVLLFKCAQNPVRACIVFLGFTHKNVLLLLGASGNSVYFPVLAKIFDDPAPALGIKWKLKVPHKSLVCLAPTCVTNIITHPWSHSLGPSAPTLHLLSDTVLLPLCLALGLLLAHGSFPVLHLVSSRVSGPVAKEILLHRSAGNYSLSSPGTPTIASSLVFTSSDPTSQGPAHSYLLLGFLKA